MFKGNKVTRTEQHRRSLAILSVAPASKFSGLTCCRLAIRRFKNVGPAITLSVLLSGGEG